MASHGCDSAPEMEKISHHHLKGNSSSNASGHIRIAFDNNTNDPLLQVQPLPDQQEEEEHPLSTPGAHHADAGTNTLTPAQKVPFALIGADLAMANKPCLSSNGGGRGVEEPNLNPSLDDNDESAVPDDQEDDGAAPSGTPLTVAEMVTSSDNLPEANEVSGTELKQTREFRQEQEQKTKQYFQRLAWVLTGVILLVAIVVLLLVLLPDDRDAIDSPAPIYHLSSTDSPTSSPTDVEGYVLSLFPFDTVETIRKDELSPQAQAFHWLVTADSEGLPYYSASRIRQRFGLATLYYALGGESWLINTDWLDPHAMECEWDQKPIFALKDTLGVVYPGYLSTFFPPTEPTPNRCNHKGELQHLWLDQNNLVGTIPEELYLLTTLQSLSLGTNRLEGTISTRLGLLTDMEGFFINFLPDGGTIPSQVGLLTKLRGLGLGDNNHHGTIPSEIFSLTTLDSLLLPRNPLLHGSLPTQMGTLTNLRWFLAESNDLTGTLPTQIGNMQKLEYLILYGNHFSGVLPTDFGRLSNLWILSLFHNLLEGSIPSQFGNLSSLFLFTARANQLTSQIPTELGKLTNLMLSLDLQDNSISGTIPTEVGLLTHLSEITLRNNRVKGTIPSQLGLLAPALAWLSLGNNHLSGTIPTELAPLQESLYTFDVDGNEMMTGTIPQQLCRLNGTCISTALAPCMAEPGLHFDCSSLCGCDCPCKNESSNSTSL